MGDEKGDQPQQRVTLDKRVLLLGLSGVFLFAWVGFLVGVGMLFGKLDVMPIELERIMIIVLALFGAVNVMLLVAFFMILILWRKSSIETR